MVQKKYQIDLDKKVICDFKVICDLASMIFTNSYVTPVKIDLKDNSDDVDPTSIIKPNAPSICY